MRSTCLLDGLAYIYMIALNRKEKICLAIILAISRKRQKKRPVGLSDVTERADETGRLPEIFASAEQVTNIIRTSHAHFLSKELNHAFPGKINFYMLLLYYR